MTFLDIGFRTWTDIKPLMEEALVLLEQTQDHTVPFSRLRDDGVYDFCAFGAALYAHNRGRAVRGMTSPEMRAVAQALYFAIPKWWRAEQPGPQEDDFPGRFHQRSVFQYNEALSRRGVLAWYKYAIRRLPACS